MATYCDDPGSVQERCQHCGHDTRHEITVEIRTESTKSKNAEFSREPYRVSTCRECGSEATTRMNNA